MWQFSKRDRSTLIKQARERRKLPLINRTPLPRKARQLLRVFPVHLDQDGGSDGTVSTQASYTYSVKVLDDATIIATAVSPITEPTATAHGGYYKRPALGSMVVATFGLAFITTDGKVALTWINETLNVGPCS